MRKVEAPPSQEPRLFHCLHPHTAATSTPSPLYPAIRAANKAQLPSFPQTEAPPPVRRNTSIRIDRIIIRVPAMCLRRIPTHPPSAGGRPSTHKIPLPHANSRSSSDGSASPRRGCNCSILTPSKPGNCPQSSHRPRRTPWKCATIVGILDNLNAFKEMVEPFANEVNEPAEMEIKLIGDRQKPFWNSYPAMQTVPLTHAPAPLSCCDEAQRSA